MRKEGQRASKISIPFLTEQHGIVQITATRTTADSTIAALRDIAQQIEEWAMEPYWLRRSSVLPEIENTPQPQGGTEGKGE